jgi:hypothetical protein
VYLGRERLIKDVRDERVLEKRLKSGFRRVEYVDGIEAESVRGERSVKNEYSAW